MKKLTNLIKNVEPKKLAVLVVATAVGAAYGVKTVAKKHKQDLANSETKRKASEVLNSTLAAGAKVVGGIREDISIVVGSAKDNSCAAVCAHCSIKDTFKPCCKDGKECTNKEKTTEVTDAEPVKAEDVVSDKEEADSLAEKLKNDVLKAEKRAAVSEAKAAAPKAPRAPRTVKAKATLVKDDSALDNVSFGAIELDDLVLDQIQDVDTQPPVEGKEEK